MGQQIKEAYRAQPMAANSVFANGGAHVAGFLATVAGTITITDADNTVLLNAMPIAVGFTKIPMLFRTLAGGTVALGGGAAGTLLL